MSIAASRLMTAEEFLALPDDGVERWLIRGELREKRDTDMTMRNKPHSITEGRVTGFLFVWLRQQPEPRGEVVCGEAGFLLRRNPDSVTAGVDVAVISAAQADARDRSTTLIVGPATLIAEVLSPPRHAGRSSRTGGGVPGVRRARRLGRQPPLPHGHCSPPERGPTRARR